MPESLAHTLLRDLRDAQTPVDFLSALGRGMQGFDRAQEQQIAAAGAKFACGKGCSLCCSLRVDVFAHEIFMVAAYIESHFTDEQIEALRERLRVHAEAVLPLSPFQHATRNIPCPLLQDGACTVYEARPLSCRRHHSLDYATCEHTYAHPSDLDYPSSHERSVYRAASKMMTEFIGAFADCDFDYTIYELGTALGEALQDPAAWKRWLVKERAFEYASETPRE